MSEQRFIYPAFRQFLREGKLKGSQCASCGALHLPPREFCPACYGDDTEWIEMSGRGRLLAFTSIHIGTSAMIEAGYGRQNPYCTGIVQLEEGPAISAQILGVDASRPETIAVGTALQVAFVQRGESEETQTFLAFEVASQQ